MTELKRLREMTGAPLNKCKEALEVSTDFETAKEFLRKKNLIFAEKKQENQSNVSIHSISKSSSCDKIMAITFTSETDFVSRNNSFLDFTVHATNLLKHNENMFSDFETILTNEILSVIKDGEYSLLDSQKQITAKIQENIRVNKIISRTIGTNEVVGCYVHKELRNSIGTSFAWIYVGFEGECDVSPIQELADDLASLVFCKKPKHINFESVPQKIVDEIIDKINQEMESDSKKKPKDIVEKIRHGRLMKVVGEDILLEQTADFHDENVLVKDYLKQFEKQHGIKLNINGYIIHE